MRCRAFVAAALTLALAIPASALTAPLTASEEVALVDKLSKYMTMYKELHESAWGNPPSTQMGNLTACKARSTAWEAIGSCSNVNCSSTLVNGSLTSSPACCRVYQGGPFDMGRPTGDFFASPILPPPQTCEDSNEHWRKTFDPENDNSDCCDACIRDATTAEYKHNPLCSGTFTGNSVGATICGRVGATRSDIYITGEPIPYKNGTLSCSTGPRYTISGLADDDRSCKTTKADIEAFFNYFKTETNDFQALTNNEFIDLLGIAMTSGNVAALADVAKSYIGGLGPHFYNAVVSGVAPYTATVNLIGGVYDDGDGANPNPMVRANGCAGEFAAPILNGVLLASRGHANIYKPTVLSAGEVQVYDYGDGNETSAWVMGGSNDGNVNSTATGQFYVHNLVNRGTLLATGTKDGFVSLVTNEGSATFTDVIGSAVDITNNGAIIVDGSSHVNMKLTSCGSSSSVVYKAGTQGGISAPYGCSVTINPGSSATVTYQEAAAPTTTPAPSILLKADPDTPHFVEVDVTMPYTVDQFNADKQTKFKTAVANAAGTALENVVILSFEPARRRNSGIVVKTKILATEAAAVTTLKSTLGSGAALLNKLNTALRAEGLDDSTGATEPATGFSSAAARSTALTAEVFVAVLSFTVFVCM